MTAHSKATDESNGLASAIDKSRAKCHVTQGPQESGEDLVNALAADYGPIVCIRQRARWEVHLQGMVGSGDRIIDAVRCVVELVGATP